MHSSLHALNVQCSITDKGRRFALNHIHVEADDVCGDNEAGSCTDGGASVHEFDAGYSTDGGTPVDGKALPTVSPYVPTQGCGKPLMGFGRALFGDCAACLCIVLCVRHRRYAARCDVLWC
ncbi:hypothetical protein CYMTET_42712 [Cymbomonas tetramitiformis]|uniref:Uncharacterized protein n=1 Tax=Cymbomonas tetramitiformis TaxID=36881 RepID=A0AAE0C5R9_9CHLO|nr:hypothetical protein CYMTET_42712 [Cymbomonas tetramitiformis]